MGIVGFLPSFLLFSQSKVNFFLKLVYFINISFIMVLIALEVDALDYLSLVYQL